jgi:signal transduction histidine kinase
LALDYVLVLLSSVKYDRACGELQRQDAFAVLGGGTAGDEVTCRDYAPDGRSGAGRRVGEREAFGLGGCTSTGGDHERRCEGSGEGCRDGEDELAHLRLFLPCREVPAVGFGLLLQNLEESVGAVIGPIGDSRSYSRINLGLALDLILEASLAQGAPDRLATALFAIVFAAPIAVRRRYPAAAVIAISVALLLQEPVHGQLALLPSSSWVLGLILCGYGAGAWLELRPSVMSAGLALVLLLVDQAVEIYVTDVGGTGGWSGALTVVIGFFTLPWLVGRFVRERRRRADAFAALATRAAADRAERERAAIAHERLVIGRELQDIIADSVSVMVVQAGGARRSLHSEPDRARESILNVEQTGRQALAEMRRLLGLLRKDDDPQALSPQPGLEQLPELFGGLRAKGLVCELGTDGEPIELTPGIDLVSYRVIETALERAAAAGCEHAIITVRYEPQRLELEVRGDRSLPAGETLRSASERVGLCRGQGWRRRRGRRPALPPRRRADGHPDATNGRAGGDSAYPPRHPRRPTAGSDTDHVRPRRVRL